mmetsp:Transcript_54043/g.101378  ORF Transcript_54043/g.101378 Transcript_54043/m.101378 type:complete len:298 (+) Transcript_54043:70-963(+)
MERDDKAKEEDEDDMTHLEKLMAHTARGRMGNIMQSSIDRFRKTNVRRKQKEVHLPENSDEEDTPPVNPERSPTDSEPSPRSKIREEKGHKQDRQFWRHTSHQSHESALHQRLRSAEYVPGELENAGKKTRVLDYYSRSASYCYNDRKFRPLRPQKPANPNDPFEGQESVTDAAETPYADGEEPEQAVVEDEVVVEQRPRQPKRKTGEVKSKEKEKAEAGPDTAAPEPTEITELMPWEDDDESTSSLSLFSGLFGSAAATLGLGEDKAAKDQDTLQTLLQAKAKREAMHMNSRSNGI